jgi:uncharacterized membrane protein
VTYLTVKWLHILSATLLFGTGLGSAFYMYCASRTGDARVVATVVGYVVIADWLFTATTVVFQPLSGFWMAYRAGIPFTTRWIAASFALYLLAGACWLPVVWMQVRMRDMARAARDANAPLPPRYWAYLRRWVALGIPAFVALLIVFWLMVVKPV